MSAGGIEVRTGSEGDMAAVAAIQAASPEGAQWEPRDYLAYDFLVAAAGARAVGFAVVREVGEGESELLNLAVDPEARRRGIARLLLSAVAARHTRAIWLEVRESNLAARNLYKSFGFREAGVRNDYYSNSGEAAIVMKIHS